MTRKIGNVLFIEPEADRICEICGATAECRPYGPDGQDICHPCGQKPENRPHVEAAMTRLFDLPKKMEPGGTS